MEAIERLCCLRVEIDVAREVELLHVLHLLYHDSLACGLSHKSQHLGVSALAEDNYLRIGRRVVLSLDAALQSQHHGARSVDYLYVVLLRQSVSLGRFAVSTQQHLHVVQAAQIVVIDSDESLLVQSLHLHTVVHDVAEAVELVALGKFLLSLLYGGSDSEAEATALVYFYCQIHSVRIAVVILLRSLYLIIIQYADCLYDTPIIIRYLAALFGYNLDGCLRLFGIVGYHQHTRFRTRRLQLSFLRRHLQFSRLAGM